MLPDFKKPNRKIHTIFIHCSGDDRAHNDNIEYIRYIHTAKKPQGNGWDAIGYHYFINKAGFWFEGRNLELDPAAQYPYNRGTLAICVSGEKLFTDSQFKSLKKGIKERILPEFDDVKIMIRGHNEVSNKLCPVFDYRQVLKLDANGFMKIIKETEKQSPAVTEVSKPLLETAKVAGGASAVVFTSGEVITQVADQAEGIGRILSALSFLGEYKFVIIGGIGVLAFIGYIGYEAYLKLSDRRSDQDREELESQEV